MNTEHLFGVYLATRRMIDAGRRRRPESTPVTLSSDPVAVGRAADREAAALRVFDAIRASVNDSQRYRRGWS